MRNVSRALAIVLLLAVIASLSVTFYKTVIKGDFEVQVEGNA